MTDSQTFRVDMPSLDAMSYIVCKSHGLWYLSTTAEKKVAICIIEDADHVIFGLQYSAFVQDRVSSNLTRVFSSSKTELDKNRHSLSFAFIGPFFENFSPHKVEQSMMHKLSCMMVNCFVYYYTHALMNFLSIAKKMMAGSQLTSFFLIFNNEEVILLRS